MKPLPEVTYLTPGEDLNMSITISGSISSEDDLTISLGHSIRGVYKDITEYLEYEIFEQDAMKDRESSHWKINMLLPYLFSEASGDLILSVGDTNSGDLTTTRLNTVHAGRQVQPFFDPVPKSVETYTGKDLLIDTRTMGSSPISVRLIISVLQITRFIKY